MLLLLVPPLTQCIRFAKTLLLLLLPIRREPIRREKEERDDVWNQV